MKKLCAQCQTRFEVSNSDLDYYKRLAASYDGKIFDVPPPTLCPPCRHQRRLAWRNERNFYHRISDLTGQQIISVFSPDSPVLVYEYEAWWSETYDPLDYGREFDFTRPFFSQFEELLYAVPQMALIGSNNENCPYCHLLANCRNCYLIVESSNNDDCYYGYWLQKCVSCCDVSYSHECEVCYEVDNCYNCYNLRWSKDCNSCSDSYFLEACIGCKDCFGCINLRQKQYCIFNQQHTRAEYEEFLKNTNLASRSVVSSWQEKFRAFNQSFPRKYAHVLMSEACTGDYILESRHCEDCFHAHEAEFCKFGEHVWRNSRYNMDVSTAGREAELIYECINTGISSYNVQFSIQCWSCSDMQYCYACHNSRNCFACSGLKKQRYCVFNKEYNPAEYQKLVRKIISHMIETGEWGEFFPVSRSLFAYNETVQQNSSP